MNTVARAASAALLCLTLASPAMAQTAQSTQPMTPPTTQAPPKDSKPVAPDSKRMAPANQNSKATAPPVAAPSGASPVVDINSSSAKALIAALPNIGDARVEAIIKNRPYLEKTELVKKAGIPQSVFDNIKDKVALVDINTATPQQMKAILTGIGDVRSQEIAKHRPYATTDDLVKKGVLTQGVYDSIKRDVIVSK